MKTLPASRMVYPKVFSHRLKYLLWRLYTPLHPHLRDTCQTLGLVKHEGRQDFLLGTVAKEDIKKFISFMISQGFGNHFVAWKDEGQVVSLRLVKDFVYQYHIRVFEDGEVRGHYEYTPECFPLLHIKAVGQEERREEFSQFLGDWVTPRV